MATVSDLQQLYIGYFGRAADQAGLNFWLDAINNGDLTLDNVHASFVNSEEYNAQYAGLTLSQKVAAVYQNVLGRDAEAEGLAFWTNAIEDGTITEDQLIEGLLSGLSPVDALAVSNKVIVANYYTSAVGANYDVSDITTSGDILRDVDSSLTSVQTAMGLVAAEAEAQGASNTDLAAALATLEAANAAQLAYAQTYLDDEDGTVATANTNIGTALTTAEGTLEGLITGLDFSTQSTAVETLLISEARTAAATAVSDARTDLAAISGAPALLTTFNARLATYEAAVDTAADTQATLNGEEVRFETILDDTVTINTNGTTAAAGGGTPVNIIVLNGSTLELDSTWANASTTTAQQLAAANTLLSAINADLTADRAVTTAETALNNTGTQLANATADSYSSTTHAFTGGEVAALQNALDAQETLADAISDYNDAAATSTEWTALTNAVTGAEEAIEDSVVDGGLGYNLVEVGTADTGTANEFDVFTFDNVPLTNNAGSASIAAEAGDVLFVGSNYVLGTDSDLIDLGIQGGDNSAFEIFFVAAGTNSQVVIENSNFGSSAAGTPEVTVISLTGITADQLSFDAQTGLVNIAEAAV